MYSKTPDIVAVPTAFRSELLTQAQLETLQGGTLCLLDEVGVHFPSRKALTIFADHGAQVDWETGNVHIPPDLVQKAMSTVPSSFVLGGREEHLDLLLDGSCSYLCTDGTGVHVVDLETREIHPSCKEDVAMMARVCDALPLVNAMHSTASVFTNDDERGLHADYEKWLEGLAPHAPISHCRPKLANVCSKGKQGPAPKWGRSWGHTASPCMVSTPRETRRKVPS